MAERPQPSEDVSPSEERTEPFSQSEMDARMRSIRVDEPDLDDVLYDAVPLSLLKVEDHHHEQGIRILVRPLTRTRSVSPGDNSCRWLALRAEVSSEEEPQHKVLAVTQTYMDIKFSVRIPPESLDGGVLRPPLWCELYYDPASDNQILFSRSEVPFTLTSLSGDQVDYDIMPTMTKALSPGCWRISVEGISVLDFRVLEKIPATLAQPGPPAIEDGSSSSFSSTVAMLNSSNKRSREDENLITARGEKKARTDGPDDANPTENRIIMFLRPTAEAPGTAPSSPSTARGTADNPTATLITTTGSRALVPADGQALIDLKEDETLEVRGGGEIDSYTVTKRSQVASTGLSSVFTAHHSNMPDGIVTVKVLKTRPAASSNPNAPQPRPHEAERIVIRQADMWLREYQSQADLDHDSIVRLHAGDARFLSLYMEHVDARDLSARALWRSPQDDFFVGTQQDAVRILGDVVSALHYMHARRRLVHNDIKPANILYSPDRGAVLCDFGLSTPAPPAQASGNMMYGGAGGRGVASSATTGGTPYYIPPEFIGNKQRGPPSDVWALGVTMLYVLRKLPYPDARVRKGKPRPLYWMIADVNRAARPSGAGAGAGATGGGGRGAGPGSGTPYGNGMSAVDQMKAWLSEVRGAADKLNPNVPLERLTKEMLIPNPNQRITTARIVREARDLGFDGAGVGQTVAF